MNVSATNTTYSNYVTQTNSSSKSENTNEDFFSALESVSNEKKNNTSQTENLLDVQSFKSMSINERREVGNKLVAKYGEEEGTAYLFSLRESSQFNDINMQNAVFDNLSEMSGGDIFMFMGDIGLSTSSYLSGNELKASYSITLDENGQVDYGDSDTDLVAYFNNISSEEFEHLFSTLKESHDSLSSVVGSEQASKYSKVYEGILSSYNDYVNSSKNESFYG